MNYISLLQSEMRPASVALSQLHWLMRLRRQSLSWMSFQIIFTHDADANIIKNVKSVVIPNSGGRKGLAAATTLGGYRRSPRA